VIVSNSSALINLSAIGHLDLLQKLYTEIIIPETVWEEVVVKGKGQPGSEEVQKAGWIKKETVGNKAVVESLTLILDKGEAEAIALAKERNAEILLMDDKTAREIAHHLGINYIGVLGVLREAKSRGLIKEMKTYMDMLKTSAGFWISKDVYEEILRLEGEA
jgi:predicted nucleic acid-binding protein